MPGIRRTRRTNGARVANDRGAVFVFVTLIIVVLILASGLAIDLGQQRVARRDAQADADVIALDMARLANGRRISDMAGSDYKALLEELTASAGRNAVAGVAQKNDGTTQDNPGRIVLLDGDTLRLEVQWGWFSEVADHGPCGTQAQIRDELDSPWFAECTQGTQFPNAARVTAHDKVDFVFLPVGDGPSGGTVTRSSYARHAQEDLAGFRVGSSLLSVNPASDTIIGQLLNSVTNGQLTLVGWSGLLDANIGLDALGQALGIPITAMSPTELANTTVTVNELAVAAANALQAGGGDTADIQLLNDFISAQVTDATVNLADVLGVDASNDGVPAAEGFVNIAQVLTTTAFLVDGEHFVDIPAADVGIPGIAGVQIRMTGIEAPRTVFGPDGASGSTRQVDVDITPIFNIDSSTVAQNVCKLPSNEQNIINTLLGGALNLVGCLLAIVIPQWIDLGVQITGTPTISLDIAEVTATQHIDCANNQLSIDTTPAVVDLLADVDLAVAATIDGVVTQQLAQVHIPAGASTHGGPGSATFTGINGTSFPSGLEFKEFSPSSAQVGANPIGLADLLEVGPAEVTALGGINLSTLANIIVSRTQPVLNQLLGELDEFIVQPLAEMLGINLGGSHLTPLWLRCGGYGVELVG